MRPDNRSPADVPVRSRWHRTDWMALLSGALFITAGVLFIAAPELGPLVMLPLVVGGLAGAGFVAIVIRAIRR
ncbi:hypothetical protein [Planobispora longispora]|uniref:Uncharacterized protein n=1 Tax=Planobispora longispora TaxID=28887 RepID=A0A8J3RKA6_9ACTN|nr:hypothetical protein [Planobispora longispora]BFE86390.1 hypothetical protein GCM10020093_089910 [Planobispora longispora]GIH75726.1 hypothetical protein Plo01_21550 [Planobispora longispora]